MTGDAMREVIEEKIEAVLADSGVDFWRECDVVPDIYDAILAAITAAPASARLALARAITPPDHAVVPVEPSNEMYTAGYAAADYGRYGLGPTYRAMIAAARGAEGGK